MGRVADVDRNCTVGTVRDMGAYKVDSIEVEGPLYWGCEDRVVHSSRAAEVLVVAS